MEVDLVGSFRSPLADVEYTNPSSFYALGSLIEGLITVLIGLLGPLMVLDNVARCGKWLTDEEKRFLVLRQKYNETVTLYFSSFASVP